MQASESHRLDRTLGLHFCSVLAEVITSISSTTRIIAIADEPFSPRPTASDAACISFSLAGGLQGHAFLVLRKSELTALGIAGLTAATSDDTRLQALSDALQPACARLVAALTQYGEVKIDVAPKPGAGLPLANVLELTMTSLEDDAHVAMHLFFDDALLSTKWTGAATPLGDPADLAAANLDLVMDVELNVTLRFGQRQLPLREVLDLTSGSVVELDRQVDEPVELILDGRVVARGEAIIIDGNYGMRITQVLQHLVP